MVLLLPSFFLVALTSAKCYEPNIAYPLPTYSINDPLLQKAFSSLHQSLTEAVAAPIYDRTSFSVEITSSKETLFSHNHTARQRNASRPDVRHVDGDAVYRIASITKTFTVLGILQQHAAGNLSLDAPVNRYLDELGEKSEGGIPWKDITLRSLSSQLSGLPMNWAEGDMINEALDVRSELGLPPDVSHDGLPTCGEYSPGYQTPCTAQDLYSQIQHSTPLFAPNQTPSYSNLAFTLLGQVLARVSNKSYESYMQSAIFSPLNMTHSGFSAPPDTAGVIPAVPHYWDAREGVSNPDGGAFSSSSDMSRYLRFILTHYNSVTHALNWMGAGASSGFGLPWEVFNSHVLLGDAEEKERQRLPVRFVTKAGLVPGYHSLITLLPAFDVGITLLFAGPDKPVWPIQEALSQTIVAVAHRIGIHRLHDKYEGMYRAAGGLNSTLELRATRNGLIFSTWISNGTDVLRFFGNIVPGPFSLQVSPTLLFREEEKKKGELWRANIIQERDQSGKNIAYGEQKGIWDEFCIPEWDMAQYAGLPMNEMVFWDEGQDGAFGRLELPAYQVNLTRVDAGKQKKMEERPGDAGQEVVMEL